MFISLALEDPIYYVCVLLTVIFSICIHELAHGIVAIRLGDRTPIELDRMTMDPLVHMGPMSLILLAIVGIAWGSMPINPTRLRGKYGEALVALAGPVSNFILALIGLTLLGLYTRFIPPFSGMTHDVLVVFLMVFGIWNIVLGLFNLLPVPPLDGSRIAANLLPGVADVMRSAAAGGGAIVAFILVFTFAGRIIIPIARNAAMSYLSLFAAH